MQSSEALAIDGEHVLAFFDGALPDVYDYLLHRCRDRTVAEDLTSETFLAAVVALRRGHSAVMSVAWLIGVARHKLVDHWRQVAREERNLGAVGHDHVEVSDTYYEPGRAVEVMAMINPMQRAALTLRYVDGLSVAEVADVIGRSVHATETLLVRARLAFRSRYKEGERAKHE